MKNIIPIQFTRINGTGNTFCLTTELVSKEIQQQLTIQVCQKYFGFSSDGVIFLSQAGQNKWRWDFYNSDGSGAEMCGNAARCVGAYVAHQTNCKSETIELITLAGGVSINLKNSDKDLYAVTMPKTKVIDERFVFKTEKGEARGFLVDTGVPHLVLESEPDSNLAKQIRKIQILSPRGVNITFIQRDDDSLAQAVTFERGVEDFTLACGTGAVAASAFMKHIHQNTQHTIEMPGGELEVSWEDSADRPTLTGFAHLEFNFQMYEAENEEI